MKNHSPRFLALVAEAKSRIQEISPADAARRQAAGALLIDVRDAEEFAQDHAVGAIGMSKGTVEMIIEKAVPDTSAEIICYCGGGYRSALVVDNLQRMGYSNVRSQTGGIRAWREQGLPTTSNQ